MGNAISSISNAPSTITDLWKCVFNAMECRSNCCDAIHCECITHEIEIESDDEEICDTCLGCNQSDYADSSGGEMINND